MRRFSEGRPPERVKHEALKTCHAARERQEKRPENKGLGKGLGKILLPPWEDGALLEGLAALLCACGYRILCEARAEGQRLGFALCTSTTGRRARPAASG